MGRAASYQASFLGGEFSPFFQGRIDDPRYAAGMNLSYNALPVEEGAHVRRPGTAHAAIGRKGHVGKLLEFHFTSSSPYNVEFTDGYIRFFSGLRLVLDTDPPFVVGISSATPAAVETNVPHGWSTGDEVEFVLPEGDEPFVGMTPLMNRTFEVTVTDTTHFTLADMRTGASIDGSTITIGSHVLKVGRVTTFATPYISGTWVGARIVQSDAQALVLCGGYPPYKLTQSIDATQVFASFTYAPAVFYDGPYLDPPTDGTTITPSAKTGTITLTASSAESINSGSGFLTSDVGRKIRLFSEPVAWDTLASYAIGDAVKYFGSYYIAVDANSGKAPDVNIADWEISTTAANWTWATIASRVGATVVTATLAPASTDAAGLPRADGALLYTTPIAIWRLGAWSEASEWPTCGSYFDSRFWLSGAQKNSLTATKSNELDRFDPTGQDGTVADNNGISETLNSDSLEPIYWMLPVPIGLLMGTKAGEWLIQASSLQDPITPTSIMAARITKYGSENIEPKQTPLSNLFIQRHGRKLLEYVPDPSGVKFSGVNLSQPAKHLLASGAEEIAYQAETTPILWVRCGDGSLAGCTYKRESPYGTEPSTFAGWHHHVLGSGRLIESIQAGPSIGGELDSLMMMTNDPATSIRHIEMMTDMFEEDDPITAAWFVDDGICPFLTQDTDGTGITIYGYWPHIGKTLTAFIGGLDCGDYVVAADGSITVPYGSDAGGLFTAAYLATLAASGVDFGALATGVQTVTTSPGVVNNPGDVQSYIYNSEASPNYATQVDWDNSLYFAWDGSNATIKAFTVPGNTEVSHADFSSLAGSGIDGFACYAGNGYIAYADGAHNAVALHIMDYSYGAIQTLGANSTNVTSTQSGILYPYTGIVQQGLGLTMLMSSSSLVPIAVTDIGSTPARYLYDAYDTVATLKHAALCPGLQRLDLATCYVMANTGGGSPTSTHLAFGRIAVWDADLAFAYSGQYVGATSYGAGDKIQYNGVQYISITAGNSGNQPDTHPGDWAPQTPQGASFNVLNRIAPAAVDATWTLFDGVSPTGLVLDKNDGNLITVFAGYVSFPGTLLAKLVKLSSTDGTVLWATDIDSAISLSSQTRCEGSRLNFFTPVQNIPTKISHIYNIDTTDGSIIATTTVHGVLANSAGSTFGSGQFSDDVSGFLIFNGDYVASTPSAPAQDGNTPATVSSTWMRVLAGHGDLKTTATGEASGVAGFSYASRGQVLRSITPQDAGTATGPALGMTQRGHMYAALLHNTQGITVGTEFGKTYPALFKTDGGVAYAANQLYSGVFQDILQDDYNFDSRLCWEVTRPYPMNVIAVNTFQKTQER